MDYILNHTSEIGSILLLIVAIYFLFRIGIRLADGSFYDNAFWAWGVLLFGIFIGSSMLSGRNPIGYLGFIPVFTLIFMRVISGINFNHDTQNTIKRVLFSGIASALTYIVTHAAFGFGIPEASVSAIVAAAVLGSVGYNA